jgi:hypothetical protein
MGGAESSSTLAVTYQTGEKTTYHFYFHCAYDGYVYQVEPISIGHTNQSLQRNSNKYVIRGFADAAKTRQATTAASDPLLLEPSF